MCADCGNFFCECSCNQLCTAINHAVILPSIYLVCMHAYTWPGLLDLELGINY